MSYPSIYENLNGDLPATEKQRLLKDYLKEQVVAYQDNPEHEQEIAYAIAGLLSTNYVRNLPEDNSFIAVLDMAGQLELPVEHRESGATWPTFIELVQQIN